MEKENHLISEISLVDEIWQTLSSMLDLTALDLGSFIETFCQKKKKMAYYKLKLFQSFFKLVY